ncbi:MAG: ABC transporter ATP-binding protein [Candidatus Kariarchaeaceae archaeon]|jgi:ATP-binding cassette subfamily B protein
MSSIDSNNNFSQKQVQAAIFKEAGTYWKYYALGILFMFLGVQARLFTPVLIGRVIDDIFVNKSMDNFWFLIWGILGLALLQAIFGFGNRYFNEMGAEKTIYNLRNKMFSSIQDQSLRYFSNESTGQLMAKLTADIAVIRSYLARDFRLGLNAIYYYVAIALIIYYTEPSLTIIFGILLPFLFIISYIYANKARPLFKQRREYYGEMSNSIQENITNIEIVQSFSQEKNESVKFEKKNKKYLDLYLKSIIVRNLSLPIALMLVSIGSVAVLYIGGSSIISAGNDSELTLGELVLFNLLMLELRTPTRLFGNFLVGYTSTNVSGVRILEVLEAKPEIQEKIDPVILDKLHGKIQFDNVCFSYDRDMWILQDLNLEIHPGTKLAILGTTGSGKSTLINLLPRFFDPTKGTIFIDDVDLKDVALEPIRKNIGVVSQETFLFSKTIRENIAFGRPDATDEDIIIAAKVAQAHQFISEFPNGYDTLVGERGITLSGGQQQRISIARTLLIDPKILILDDSTSSVDAETEAEIQQVLKQLLEDRTTLIITQKVSSLRLADKIIVLEHGKIVEEGTHEELLNLGGLYSDFYSSQEDQELKQEIELIIRGSS